MNDCTENEETNVLMPCMYLQHDLERYSAEIELPGVRKEDIDIEVMENGMCISGKRGETELSGCWLLTHQIKVDEVKARYEEGILDIDLPLKNPLKRGRKVKVE